MTVTMRSALRWAALLALFTALAVIMTWPLARQLDLAVSDPGDPFILMWTLHHDYSKTLSDPANLFHAPIFHPLRYTLAFSEHIYGIAVFAFPLFAAGLSPTVIYNVMLLLGIVTTAVGAFILCRQITGSGLAAIAGTIAFTFVPFRFMHLPHLQHQWVAWLPLLFAALLFWNERPGWRRAALIGGAFFMNGLTNVHWFLFGSVAFALVFLFLVAIRPESDRSSWRQLLQVVVAIALASLLLLPFYLPYKTVESLYGMQRDREEITDYSARIEDWANPASRSRVWGESDAARSAPPERALFPGIVFLLLAGSALFLLPPRDNEPSPRSAPPSPRLLRTLDVIVLASGVLGFVASAYDGTVPVPVAALRWRGATLPLTVMAIALLIRCWLRYPGAATDRSLRHSVARSRLSPAASVAVLLVVIGFVGSLGTNAFFHDFLARYVEAFRAIRVPARWAMIVYLGLAMLAAIAVQSAISRFRGRAAGVVIATLVSLALLLEANAAPIRWYRFDPEPAAVYHWLRTAPTRGAVLELPIDLGGSEYRYLFGQIVHGKPIVNGISGFVPKTHDNIRSLLMAGRTDDLTTYLEKRGVGVVIVHADPLIEQHRDVHRWIDAAAAKDRLRLVARFDEGTQGAWVFAVKRNYDPAVPASAATLMQHFQSGSPLPARRTFGYVDFPQFWDELQGEFTIFGWALSPHDVKQVDVLFDNGRYTLPAERGDYPQLRARYPWYPNNAKPAFWLRLPAPPSSRPGDHDFQVRVIDGSGKAKYLEHVWFSWKPDEQYGPKEWHKERSRLLARGIGEPDSVADALRNGTMKLADLRGWWIEKNRHIDNTAFVDASYRAFLGRQVSAEERARTLLKMRGSMNRDAMVRSLTNSKEFARRYLKASAQRDRGLIE